MVQTVHTGSFGPLLGSFAGLEGSLTRVVTDVVCLSGGEQQNMEYITVLRHPGAATNQQNTGLL